MIEIEKFILGGNATFTVTSLKTGTRFTFKVRKPSDEAPHFVSLMNGPDNESNYAYLGTIFGDLNYRHGRKSRVTPDATSAKAFNWLWNHRNDSDLDTKIEFRHAGKCCCCGRKLTEPESIDTGIGPICRAKKGW